MEVSFLAQESMLVVGVSFPSVESTWVQEEGTGVLILALLLNRPVIFSKSLNLGALSIKMRS